MAEGGARETNELLESLRDVLRVSNDTDGEIEELIAGAMIDLKISGVKESDVEDPLIKRAITLYCKAHFGYDDPKLADRYERNYLSLRDHLVLSEYRAGDWE